LIRDAFAARVICRFVAPIMETLHCGNTAEAFPDYSFFTAKGWRRPLIRLAWSFTIGAALFCIAASPATAQGLPRADGATTPVKRYGPDGGCGPAMIISPGFGGNEEGNAALASAMGTQGWRVLVMGHRESGREAFRAAMLGGSPKQGILEATTTPPKHRARFLDLDAAIAEMTRRCRPAKFVLAGHSMGAMTTMLEAGSASRFGRFGGNRFDAYVAISPQGVGYTYAQGAWSGVSKPVLMITGARDQGSDGGVETRLSAFEGLPPGNKRFAIIPGAGHIALSANWRDDVGRAVSALTIEFVNAIGGGRALPPSSLRGIDIRDK
jgi:pimeloyl-ACP methyl ester carboxylesterase